MWKPKIGISICNNYCGVATAEVVKIVSEIGFDAISPEWENGTELFETICTAKKCGLEIQSLHAPFGKSADMWSKDTEKSKVAKRELLHSLEQCRKYGIPIMVLHTWIGFDYTFEATEEGFKNYEEIVEQAEKYGVKIAFENTEGEEYLFALMEYFKDNETVGYCWDSGHEMCYNHSKDLLAKFGDKLVMTHINDNLGISRHDGKTFWTDDLHLLPYDGIADWNYNIKRLKQSRKQEILNFELNMKSKPGRHENDIYSEMGLTQFFTEAYKCAYRIVCGYSNQCL